MPAPLLVISDGVAATGYSRLTHNILRNLPRAEYEIHHLAVNYNGDPHDADWKIYPACVGGDVYGVNRIKDLVKKVQPKLIFTAQDLWIQQQYMKVLSEYAGKIKLVMYSPVDAGPVDPEWLEKFELLDRLVMFTRYGKSEVQKAFAGRKSPSVEVIPLGVDTEVYFPFPKGDGPVSPAERASTKAAKAKLRLVDEKDIDDSFIVLNANRNQPRKRIDITMKGFARFAEGKPSNVLLYLHMGTTDVGWNILKLAKRYGIDDRLLVSENRSTIPGVSEADLNLIYNACDVGINTATGEGWGLPSFEHAAAGKAQIVPRINTCEEIWSEAAEFLEPDGEVVFDGILTEGKVVSPAEVARALEALYSDRDRLTQVADACFQRTQRPECRWTSIGDRWHRLFQEVLAGESSAG